MASLVAQTVKCLPTLQETQVWSLGQEDPLEKAMATHSSTLAWKIPWKIPVGYSPWGCKESDTTTLLHFTSLPLVALLCLSPLPCAPSPVSTVLCCFHKLLTFLGLSVYWEVSDLCCLLKRLLLTIMEFTPPPSLVSWLFVHSQIACNLTSYRYSYFCMFLFLSRM